MASVFSLTLLNHQVQKQVKYEKRNFKRIGDVWAYHASLGIRVMRRHKNHMA